MTVLVAVASPHYFWLQFLDLVPILGIWGYWVILSNTCEMSHWPLLSGEMIWQDFCYLETRVGERPVYAIFSCSILDKQVILCLWAPSEGGSPEGRGAEIWHNPLSNLRCWASSFAQRGTSFCCAQRCWKGLRKPCAIYKHAVLPDRWGSRKLPVKPFICNPRVVYSLLGTYFHSRI